MRGTKVLLNFLCGCAQCVEMARGWETIHSESQTTIVLGIATVSPSHIQEFRRVTHITFPILFDPGFRVAERYHALQCPRSWVVDEAGRALYDSGEQTAPARTGAELSHLLLRDPKETHARRQVRPLGVS
jgi:peroxiredoxin